MTGLPRAASRPEEARPGDRPRHLRRLPRLRGRLQGMERRRPLGAADRRGALRRGAAAACGSTACTATRSSDGDAQPHGALPALLPALREPACVTVCPTGASYKRAEDGIVLVDEDKCIGCKLCSWACPYGAREFDDVEGVMKKCTLCIDRIYNENLPEERARAGLRAACPTARAAFRRPRRSGVEGVEAGRRARRRRPDAGAGLRAGQQATCRRARAPPAIRTGTSAASDEPRRPRPRLHAGAALARPRAVALTRTVTAKTPCIPRFPSSSSPRVGRRLRPADLLGVAGAARRCCRPAPASASRRCGFALALVTVGLLVLDCCTSASRSARGARSRNGAPRGCRAKACWRSRPSCRRALLRRRLDRCSARTDGVARRLRPCSPAPRSPAIDGVLHGDDLRLAASRSSVAQR